MAAPLSLTRDQKINLLRHKVSELKATRTQARSSMLGFISHLWWKPEPFLAGQHTVVICREIDRAVDRYLAGKSTFLDIAVPFRHGKSSIISIALPAYFLGRLSDRHPDVIMSGYGGSLVEGFSKDVKKVIRSPAYRGLFPGIRIDNKHDTAGSWSIEGSTGEVTVQGLGGTITGKGAQLLVVDDYCKNRAEARSGTYRKNTWESFQNDLMTRRAPVSIVIICATRWFVDDVSGRIAEMMAADPNFPQFKRVSFPARFEKNGKTMYLFPERFSREWYESQYSVLGKSAAALLDSNPVLEGGNRFIVDGIHIHDDPKDFPNQQYVRAWDVASSKREREKDNPDATVGLLGTITTEYIQADDDTLEVHTLWIKHGVTCQQEAPERDAMMQQTARTDGPEVPVVVESYGGYKDTYTALKSAMRGVSRVHGSTLPGDKGVKLAPLESIFEAGNVHLVRGDWNQQFIDQFRGFPDAPHDDWCDPAGIIYHWFAEGYIRPTVSGTADPEPEEDDDVAWTGDDAMEREQQLMQNPAIWSA